MRKRDVVGLLGGTATGMSVVLTGLAAVAIQENFTKRCPRAAKPGTIESVDEMHIDYLRRRALEWVKTQEKEDLEIKSKDGLTLRGQYIHNIDAGRAADEPKKVVLLSHGYGGTGIKDLMIFVDFYRKQGFDICVIDQRAHGLSDGAVITFGAKEQGDLIRWVRTIVGIAGDDCKILLHGWSMGAAICYLAAAEGLPPQVKGLVYDCGYSVAEAQFLHSAKKMTHLAKPLLWYIIQAMKPLLKLFINYDMKDSAPLFVAKDMKLPIFFVHGAADEIVPLWMGRKLYEATNRASYRDMLIVPEANHTYSYLHDRKGYEAGILKLLENCDF